MLTSASALLTTALPTSFADALLSYSALNFAPSLSLLALLCSSSFMSVLVPSDSSLTLLAASFCSCTVPLLCCNCASRICFSEC